MNRKKLLIVAKVMINSGILCLLPLPLLSYEAEYKKYIALFGLAVALVGCFLCLITGKTKSEWVRDDNQPSRLPITWYFKTIKWSVIAAMAFHIIAALIILFFYWLKRELEATLLITLGVGVTIGFVCEIAIPYYKRYKDRTN